MPKKTRIFFCLILSLLLLFLASYISPCKLNGYDSGECLPVTDLSASLPFCFSELSGTICVPRIKKYFPYNLTITAKDQYVKSIYIRQTEAKLFRDINDSTQKVCYICAGKSCRMKYKHFLCKFNFPTCEEGVTQQVCRSACTGFTEACGYNTDLCVSKYQNLNDGFRDCV